MDRHGPKTKEDFKDSLVFQRDLAEMLGQEVKALRARVKELEAEQTELIERAKRYRSEREHYREENARLRKVLELIAKPNLSLADSDGLHRQEIAEKALREPDGATTNVSSK